MSNTETSPLICSANQWTGFYMRRPSGVFIVNFEHISHIFLGSVFEYIQQINLML